MLSKRKQLHQHKMDKVLKKYNTILVYQHSGLTTIRWKELREILAQMPKSASTLPLLNEDTGACQQELCSRPEASAVVIFVRDKIAFISEKLQILSDNALWETHKGDRKETMYQGPILLVACNSHEDMVSAHSVITKQAEKHKYSVLLLGGSYYHTTLNHKDVCRLVNLDKSIYTSFLDVVESAPKTLTCRLVTGQHNLITLIRNSLSKT
jgi:hypothetical protein